MRNNIILTATLIAFIFSGCVDHTFDEPPGFEPEVVEANGDIGDLLDNWIPESITEITDDLIIDGRVVANDDTGNFYKQLVIQDDNHGIQIRLDAIGLFNAFPIGRKISVKCQGLFISDYNGLPQLSAVTGSGVDLTSIAIPEPLIPEIVFNSNDTESIEPEIIDIQNAGTDYLNRLVKLNDVQFTLGSVARPLADAVNQFSVNHDIEDCNERTMIVRTSGFSSFANIFTPTGKGSITGVLSVFRGDYQLLLRTDQEIMMDGERCDGSNNNNNSGDPVDSVDEDFETLNDNQDVDLEGWSNIAVKGTRLWRAKEFDGNVYVQATAYNDTNAEMETWLVTPKIKFDTPMKMTLKNAIAFYTHDGLSVWYATDFDGNNVNAATWKELSINKAGNSDANYAWVNSGEIDLTDITQEAHIAFKYVGNPTNGTTSVIIDDVKIVSQ